MNSFALGTSTSQVEVTHIDQFGIWLLACGKEYFLAYQDFPWFRQAKIDDVLRVQLLHEDHLYWPSLDIDLSIESIEQPEAFPLKYGD